LTKQNSIHRFLLIFQFLESSLYPVRSSQSYGLGNIGLVQRDTTLKRKSMDNNRETPRVNRERETDEVTSPSESYTSTESDEYDSLGDGSNDVASDHRYKTTLIKNDFVPEDGTNRALKIEMLISPRAWRDDITAKCTHKGKSIGHAIARFIYRGMITKDFWEKMDECSQDAGQMAWRVFD
jgi:hypothetical protein